MTDNAREEREPEGWINVPERVHRALEATDAMPAELRQCVHEYGFAIVSTLLQVGITKPSVIRSIVHSIWCGARSQSASQRFGHGGKSQPSAVLGQLDWLLLQNGAQISAVTLVRVLWMSGMVIVPREPNEPMVRASIEATARMGLVSKSEKHKGRLKAALQAAAERLWPHLIGQSDPRAPIVLRSKSAQSRRSV